MRDLADVSMNLQPNCLARFSPSAGKKKLKISIVARRGRTIKSKTNLLPRPRAPCPNRICWRPQWWGSSPCPSLAEFVVGKSWFLRRIGEKLSNRSTGSLRRFACTVHASPSIPPGQRYLRRPTTRPHHRRHTACGTNLWNGWIVWVTGSAMVTVAMSPTFDCRVIFVHEVALNQLDGEAWFSDTSTSDNNQLVLS